MVGGLNLIPLKLGVRKCPDTYVKTKQSQNSKLALLSVFDVDVEKSGFENSGI